MRTVYLDYAKARDKLIDREEFIEKYQVEGDAYKMTSGTPIAICIEGSYILANDLLEVTPPRSRMLVSRYLMGLKLPSIDSEFAIITFKWSR